MSFSCPHYCPDEDHCLRLKTDCVAGRRGCVLEGKAVFAVPAEERVRLKEEEKRRAAAGPAYPDETDTGPGIRAG